MSSIRFVRPPTDNRVRNFPNMPNLQLPQQSVMSSLSSGDNGACTETTDVIHITTPKRKNSYVPPWNLFITSTEVTVGTQEVENKNMDTIERAEEKETELFATSKSTKSEICYSRGPLFIKAGGETVDKTCITFDSNENILNCPKSRPLPNHISELSRSSSCTKIYDANQNLRETTRSWVGTNAKSATKCPILNFYANFGQVSVDDKVWDVQEEEITGLPEVGTPTRILSPTTHRESQQAKTDAHPEERPSPVAAQSHTMALPSSRDTELNMDQGVGEPPAEEEEEDKSFFSRHAGTFRRSVSAAALDNYCTESFFSSINDERFYELGNSQPTGIDDPSFLMTQYRKCANQARRNAWGKQDKDFDKIEECHSQTESGSRDMMANHDGDPPRKSGQPKASHLGEKSSNPFAAIKDILACERFKKRRFALADPERMIMSQAVREKIEKEVEKRKASVARKVSQFFNVRMGLNKEEDLI